MKIYSPEIIGDTSLTGALDVTGGITSSTLYSLSGSFLNLNAVSASFGHVTTVTGSAVIIGDEFIILNADTPAARYAGLIVYDSGSGSPATASLEWDGLTDNWIVQEESGNTAVVLTGPTGSRGVEILPTVNRLQKGGGHHQLIDSSLTDNGTTITGNTSIQLTGADSSLTGSLRGLATNADNIQISSNNPGATTTSLVLVGGSATGYLTPFIDTGLSFNAFTNALTTTTFVGALDGTASFATSASFATTALSASFAPSTPAFPFTGSAIITGSITITGSAVITDSLVITGSLSSGTNNIASGPNSAAIGGESNTITGNRNVAIATENANLTGTNAFVIGGGSNSNNSTYGGILGSLNSTMGGAGAQSSNILGGENHSLNGFYNGIIGGTNHTIDSTLSGSVILGGSNITASQSDTVYVPNLLVTGSATVQGGLTVTGSINVLSGSFSGSVINNITDVYTSSPAVEHVVSLTQAEYNTISGSADPNTLYYITDATPTVVSASYAVSSSYALSSSFATTASFYSLASVDQDVVITGSVRGNVSILSVSSNTASLDLSTGNFYTLSLVSGSNTFVNPSNILPGQTINLRITQPDLGFGTVSFPSSVKQVSGSAYVPTAAAFAQDIVTFISFDASSLYLSNVKNLV